MTHTFDNLPEIINRHPASPESLIMILQDIQKEYHYLSCEALREVASSLLLPLSKVFSVATFYNAFSLQPRGEKTIRVCVGTACHIRGATQIQHQFESLLGIRAGDTTKDMKYTLEVVGCVGACALAPVVIVDGKYNGSFNISRVKRVIGKK